MKKTAMNDSVNARLSDIEVTQLDALCEKHKRNRSDMVRILIDRAYTTVFSPRPEHRTVDAATRYAAIE